MSDQFWPQEVVEKANAALYIDDDFVDSNQVLDAIRPDIKALVDVLKYVMDYPTDPDYMATDDDRAKWDDVYAVVEKWRGEKP